jgi:cell fate regulator YaaT (PSP1 superfamily)
MNEANSHLQTSEKYIIGLRFQRVGKVYYFDASNIRDIKPGDFVIVETSRGRQLGQMIMVVNQSDSNLNGGIKPVLRKATPQDLVQKQSWEQKEVEAVVNCREKASELGFSDVKIISAEYSFDGSRLYYFYSSEEGEKTDLKSLRRTMQRVYAQTHIEIHLIGPRDVAKILGGMGACGLGTRCCSAFLTDFSPISIKMAKEQGISLTPTEITGMCGRLRCCLVYEYEQYVEARKQLPKRGKRVGTPLGEGKIVDVLTIKGSVIVEMDKGGQHEFMHHEIQPLDELDALRKKAEYGCNKHTEGGCDCGKGSLPKKTL